MWFTLVVQTVAVLQGGWTPNLLCPTPWYSLVPSLSVACSTELELIESWAGPGNEATLLRQYINMLIFRVRPCACYVKGTMKRQKSIYSI